MGLEEEAGRVFRSSETHHRYTGNLILNRNHCHKSGTALHCIALSWCISPYFFSLKEYLSTFLFCFPTCMINNLTLITAVGQ